MRRHQTSYSVENSSPFIVRIASSDDSFSDLASPEIYHLHMSRSCSLRPVHLSPGSRPFGLIPSDFELVVDLARRSIDAEEGLLVEPEIPIPVVDEDEEDLKVGEGAGEKVEVERKEEDKEEEDGEFIPHDVMHGLSPFFGFIQGCKPPPTTPIHSLFPRTDSEDRVDFNGDALIEKHRKTEMMVDPPKMPRPVSVGVFQEEYLKSPKSLCRPWDEMIEQKNGEESEEGDDG
eukprot:TRINITY_DN6152_c0_g1_i1.p1 TRINITY_DN6152_c0_g1~~TRINITY_DN6152_c0_g1_i1.p1  ORF type:complete len:232 (-),score=84.58 TRINITY_DN6152_c0_g1_i1:360-1055(-)